VDPATGKREARSGRTFGDLMADYLKHKKSGAEAQRIADSDILPLWKTRPVKAITRRDVHDLIEGIVDRGAPVMANRVLGLISAVFYYGLSKDWLAANPARGVQKQREEERERVLTDEELSALWTALDSAQVRRRATEAAKAPAISPMIALGLQMILLTAQRPGEVFNMRWDELDLASNWWTIPREKTKNGKAHRVPLTARALELLQEAKRDSPGDNPWVFAGNMGANVAARAKKAAANLRAAGAVSFEFHRHDLRRTAATGMATAGVFPGIIGYVLNHSDGNSSRVTAIYNRYDYDKEKRTALETWGRRINAIVSGKTEARVVPFKAAAGASSRARGARR
jgi:integrase